MAKCRLIHLSLVHVGVVQSSHEWVRAYHLPLANAGARLGVAAGKLVDVDGDHVVPVVKLDGALESEKAKKVLLLKGKDNLSVVNFLLFSYSAAAAILRATKSARGNGGAHSSSSGTCY